MAAADFCTIAGLTIPLLRTGVDEQPDGAFGKRRWTLSTAQLDDETLEPSLRAAIGTPGAAESDRAADGTLHTTQPLVTLAGRITGGAAVPCEVQIKGAKPVHVTGARFGGPGGGATTRRTLTLQVREG